MLIAKALARFHIDIISSADGWICNRNLSAAAGNSEIIIHDVKLLNALTWICRCSGWSVNLINKGAALIKTQKIIWHDILL